MRASSESYSSLSPILSRRRFWRSAFPKWCLTKSCLSLPLGALAICLSQCDWKERRLPILGTQSFPLTFGSMNSVFLADFGAKTGDTTIRLFFFNRSSASFDLLLLLLGADLFCMAR